MKLAQETAGSAPEGAVSAQSAFDAAAAAKAAKKNHMTRREAAWLAFKRDKGAIISLSLLLIIVVVCLIAPLLPLAPNATDVAHRLAAPSAGPTSPPVR